MSGPRTYAAAIKVATPVSRAEFEALVAESKGSVTVFEARKMLRHASGLNAIGGGLWRGAYSYDYCTPRSGYTQMGFVCPVSVYKPPVFDFYQQGRIVTVEPDEADLVRQAEARARVFASLAEAITPIETNTEEQA